MKITALWTTIMVVLIMISMEISGQEPIDPFQQALVDVSESTIVMEIQQQKNNLAIRLAVLNSILDAETNRAMIDENDRILTLSGYPQLARNLPPIVEPDTTQTEPEKTKKK